MFGGRLVQMGVQRWTVSALLIGGTILGSFAAQAQGPVAAYAFSEGSGTTVADKSGNGLTGTIAGATWTTSGKYGNALVFNGTSAIVNVPNATVLQLTTGMTLEAWVNPSVINSAWRDVIYKADDNYYLEASSTSNATPGMGGTFSPNPLTGTTPLTTNTWTYLAATYDGKTMLLFINGVQVASKAQTGTIATSTNALQIGGDSFYGQYFSGTIDEVRIYNRALSSVEIQADMNTPIDTTTAPPPPPPSSLAISPTVAALTFTRTMQFTANMSPVLWYVDGVQGGAASTGTISSTGLYTPPSAVGTHTVTVKTSDLLQTANATVYITNVAGVYTHHYDNLRTGQSPNEWVLTPATVNSTTFGKLTSYPLDGLTLASPLYVANLNMPGLGYHNVVYVATEHNSVYAFDADALSTNPLWHVSFLGPNVTTVPCGDTGECGDIPNEIGITSTPVIDPATGTMYVVAATKENTSYVQRLHALDITTGAEKFGGPIVIQATVSGSGSGSTGNKLSFDPLHENQRPGLLLLNGVVYLGFGSHGDIQPYHGWILAYNATTLQQVFAWCSTPNTQSGGIWQSGGGLATDASGNIFFATGDGTFNANTGGSEYGDCIVKLTPSSTVGDYFAPFDQAAIDAGNLDLCAGGVLLLPDQPGPHRHLLISSGKNSTVYLVNRDTLGHYNSVDNSNAVQTLPNIFPNANGTATPGDFINPVYFNGMVYFSPVSDNLQAFSMTNGLLSTAPVMRSAESYTFPGGAMSVSANGTVNPILWIVQRNGTTAPGVLYAYNPSNLSNIYYNSSQAGSRDALDPAAKFNVPLVVNGKVFVASQGQLSIFGGISPGTTTIPAPPTLASPANGATGVSTSPTFTWNASSGAAAYQIQVSTDPNFGTTVVNQSNITTTSYSASGLVAGTLYYWHVNATNSAGTSPYSTAWSFTTAAPAPPPPVPTLASPANGSTGVPTSPTLSWNASTGATSYRIQISTDPNFGSAAVDQSNITTTSYAASGLAASTLYYWHVNATNSGGTSAYSSAWSFTTVALPAGLVAAYAFDEGTGTTVSDKSGNNITGTIVGATWTTSGKYGNALSFNGTTAYVDLGNPTQLQITGSMTWSAWVNAAANPPDDGQIIAKSNNSSGWQLKSTPDTGPETFGVAVSGSGNTQAQRYSKTVRSLNTWYYVAGVYNATSKTLDIYVNGVLDDGTLTGTIPSSEVLPNVNVNIGRRSGGFYFNGIIDEVRVYSRALSQAEIQTDMNTPLGTPQQPPAAPVLALPANGATGVSIPPILTWNASTGATSYRIQVSTDSTFATTTVNQGNITITADTVAGLLASTTYFWHVNATNTAGTSAYSPSWKFTTAAPPPPPAVPVLASPANGTTGVSTGPTLTWNASTGASSYHLQVSTNGSFATTNVDQANITTTSYTATGLAASTLYYWHVSATNSGGTSAYSSAWSFTTAAVPAGLVAAYTFDEGSGTTVSDKSGNNLTGTISGATWTTGKYGSALSFNGTNALVSVPNASPIQLTSGMTLEAWVNPAVVNSAWRDVIYKADDNYYLEATSTQNGVPGMGGTFSANPVYGTGILPANTWSYLTGTYDGTTMRLYVNAVQVSSKSQTGTIATSTNALQIGGDSFYGQYFQGIIDEVRVYNRALSQTEIQTDMNTAVSTVPAASPIFEPGLQTSQKIVPTAYALDQNYPNPFNPSTVIRYEIPEAGGGGGSNVRLVIYDILGREVAVLVDEQKAPGIHEVKFDGTNLATGMYICRITAGQFVQVRKMLLTK